MSKQKWLWRLLIGIGVAVILGFLFVSYTTPRAFCVEPQHPSCGDPSTSFLLGLRFFIPAGAIAGLFFGLIFDRKYYAALAVLLAGVLGFYLFYSLTRPSIITQSESAKEKAVSWNEAIRILDTGQVKLASQSHNLDVYLHLKDGTRLKTKEPRLGDIFSELKKCGEPCKDIPIATE